MRAESPGTPHQWLDDDAGPVVRPYTLTGGRVRLHRHGDHLRARRHHFPCGSVGEADDSGYDRPLILLEHAGIMRFGYNHV